MEERNVDLVLERVIWESRVWVDGRCCNSQESLNTPHTHTLGRFAANIPSGGLRPVSITGRCIQSESSCSTSCVPGRRRGSTPRRYLGLTPAQYIVVGLVAFGAYGSHVEG